MEKRKASVRYSPEVTDRAIRMAPGHAKEHASEWTAIGSIAAKIGSTWKSLRGWTPQAERDRGLHPGLISDDQAELTRGAV